MENKESKENIFAPEAILLKSPFRNPSLNNTPNLNSITRINYHINPNAEPFNSPQAYLQKLRSLGLLGDQLKSAPRTLGELMKKI